jgi:hypothetical protein
MSKERQHPSVKDLHRPNLPVANGNNARYSTDHITSGAAKTPHKTPGKDKREPSPIMYPDMPASLGGKE